VPERRKTCHAASDGLSGPVSEHLPSLPGAVQASQLNSGKNFADKTNRTSTFSVFIRDKGGREHTMTVKEYLQEIQRLNVCINQRRLERAEVYSDGLHVQNPERQGANVKTVSGYEPTV